MRDSMEQALTEALQESPETFLEVVETRAGRGCKALLVKALAKCSRVVAAGLCEALHQRVSCLFESFETWVESPELRPGHLAALRACALVAQAGVAPTSKAFQPSDVYPTVLLLHNGLVKLEDDQGLQEIVARMCETWWRNDYEGKKSLVSQSLPFLLSRSLESGKKADVRRVYALRDALCLFDFGDESIEDLKHLLIRCILTPTYLRTAEGCRILSCMFGLNAQLVKELVTILRSQIPFSTKSILATFGEILYRAWKDSEACRLEIEGNCIQGLIEGAIYANTKELALSVRRVLDGFFLQKAHEGVEAMLFRLHEPILFRSLQVANSDVRRNALLLLIEVFPLQDPNAPKEEREAVLEKQFLLFEKMLVDPCPDVRCIAVEGVCRILRYFWEILPSSNTVKFLSLIVDDMANDQTSSSVRVAVISGLTYLLENPQSHSLLQAFLPRVGPMLNDTALNVRIAVADMLLAMKRFRALDFSKVAKLNFLMSCLASDNYLIARRLTRLLIPSYLPCKLPPVEACHRCVTLIKRSPGAGANFCKWALEEGVSRDLLLELVKALSSSDVHRATDPDDVEGIIACLLEICCALAAEKDGRQKLGELLSVDVLTSLMDRVSTPQERSSILRIASLLPPKEVPKLVAHCGTVVLMSRAGSPSDLVQEIKAVHSLVLAWGGFDDLVDALIKLLKHVTDLVPGHETHSTEGRLDILSGAQRGRKRRKSAWVKVMSRRRKGFPCSPAGRFEESEETSFVAAVGAAWQVETLLAEEGTREALLACDAVGELLGHLREVAHRAVARTEASQACGDMEASPLVLAYAKLSMHCAIQEGNGFVPRQQSTSSTKGKGGRKASSKPSMAALPVTKRVDELLEELVRWAGSVHDAALPRATRLPQNSPPPVQPRAKYARDRNSKQRARELLQPSSFPAEETDLEVLSARASVLTVTLQAILEALSLKLVTGTSVRERCATFAKKTIDWTREGLLWLIKSSIGAVSIAGKHKDFLNCVKVNASYAGKMVYLTLRYGTELWSEISAVAHSLLDLLAVSDSFFGPSSPVGTAVRPWLPDILIAMTTALSPPLDLGHDADVDPADRNLQALFADEKTLRPWVGHFAKSGFLDIGLQEEVPVCTVIGDGCLASHEGHLDPTEGKLRDSQGGTVSSVSGVFVHTIVKLLRKGDNLVAREFVDTLVRCTAFLFSNQEYSDAAGLLAVICTQILGCRHPGEKGLDLTLRKTTIEELQRLQGQVSVALTSNDGEAQEHFQFQVSEKLLRLALASYKTA